MDYLDITDSRTGKGYKIPISNGYIDATDVAKIVAPESGLDSESEQESKYEQPLRILSKGFENTAVVESSITYVDGKRGIIRYRDHDIQKLFHDYVFEDVMHLLIWGSLPSQAEKDHVRALLCHAMHPPESVRKVVEAFPRNADVVAMISATLSAFAATDETVCASHQTPKPMFQGLLDVADGALVRLMAYQASTVALIYCHKYSKDFTPPEPGRSLISNLLWMMGVSQVNPKAEECLNKLWILYADHEMTNSTAAVMHLGSSLLDPVFSGLGGIIAGYGPLHGGAILLAYNQLAMMGKPEQVPAYVEELKRKNRRVYGYGHRIYKTRDPRLSLIEGLMEKYQDEVNANPLVRVASALDKYASQDPYFVERKLQANADLKGCFLYTALGFEPDMILAITGISRAAGCMAHWRESLTQPMKLWRPLQKYTGSPA
ncbi:citrate synthase [Xylariaceae sp. FL1272]|nr:citrate synthase [Xylariaceae sp. FL1272]